MPSPLALARRRPLAARSLALAALLILLAGCGQKKAATDTPVTIETLPSGVDTSGLADGKPVIEGFAVDRMDGGALRVRGRTTLPAGTRLQITITEKKRGLKLLVTQMTVADGGFESVPLMGDAGPFPPADYRFELLSHFTSEWQTADVLRQIGGGMSLRGPGITRSQVNGAALYLVEELHR